jgi:hypothetical protein
MRIEHTALLHPRLRGTWLLAAIALAACIVITIGATYLLQRAQSTQRSQDSQLRSLLGNVLELRSQLDESVRAKPVSRALDQRGFFKSEDRHVLVERLVSLKEKHGIESANMAVSNQANGLLQETPGLSQLKVGVSLLELELTAAREGPLLAYIQQLPTQLPGVLRTTRCKLDRSVEDSKRLSLTSGAQNGRKTKLTCEFEWITAKDGTEAARR